MPFRRYRRGFYRRRRFPRRRRFVYYSHPWHRRWRRRWRRRRNPPVRQPLPKSIRSWIVQGVEILGVQGSEVSMTYDNKSESSDGGQWQINIRNVAPTNKEVVYLSKMIPPDLTNQCSMFPRNKVSYWDFVGGWGNACISLYGLIFRLILGFAKANRTLNRAQYIKFNGVQFQLQRAPDINYIFYLQKHRNLNDFIKPLLTPLNLMNTPGSIIVNSIQRSKCCKMPIVRRKADPEISGWHDIEKFMKEPLVCYAWSAFNPNNPMGRNPQITKFLSSPLRNSWFNEHEGQNISEYCPPWQNRQEYDKEFVDKIDNAQDTTETNVGQTWWEWINNQVSNNPTPNLQCTYGRYAPFSPPMLIANTPQTLWVRYKFFFKIAGRSFGFERTNWPVLEADTCSFCKPNCSACIDPKRDLKKDGLLTKKAFKRITQPPHTDKKRSLEVLARALRRKLRKRKRVRWLDQQSPRKRQKTTITMGL
nr:MAG: ORF1 [Torque teno polar bear virus 25]